MDVLNKNMINDDLMLIQPKPMPVAITLKGRRGTNNKLANYHMKVDGNLRLLGDGFELQYDEMPENGGFFIDTSVIYSGSRSDDIYIVRDEPFYTAMLLKKNCVFATDYETFHGRRQTIISCSDSHAEFDGSGGKIDMKFSMTTGETREVFDVTIDFKVKGKKRSVAHTH